ncbi:MAG: hypothetical protein KAR05_06450 [Candidatus Omnitrophica bacterium]|nr:hypothetical protein [Candidatus Omnitrophota bacterium]
MDKSYKVLKKAIDKVGAKRIAARMHLSPALVYKWCQPNADKYSDEITSGANNPLDRIQKIYEITGDPEVINWLCELADGYFVQDAQAEGLSCDARVLKNMQTMIKEFSETLGAISKSYVDRRITLKEAEVIRKEWNDLKRIGEAFVRACESGKFDK